jgi:hypothetical protein
VPHHVLHDPGVCRPAGCQALRWTLGLPKQTLVLGRFQPRGSGTRPLVPPAKWERRGIGNSSGTCRSRRSGSEERTGAQRSGVLSYPLAASAALTLLLQGRGETKAKQHMPDSVLEGAGWVGGGQWTRSRRLGDAGGCAVARCAPGAPPAEPSRALHARSPAPAPQRRHRPPAGLQCAEHPGASPGSTGRACPVRCSRLPASPPCAPAAPGAAPQGVS